MAVEKFLALKIKPSFGLVSEKTDRAYSRLVPNQDTTCLLARPIPNQSIVELMVWTGCSGWEHLCGGSDTPSSRLPLRCIQFWIDVFEVINARSKWGKSMAWVDKEIAGGDSELLQVAHDPVKSLRWNEYRSIPAQAATSVFAATIRRTHHRQSYG
jgi:hypothetical protein